MDYLTKKLLKILFIRVSIFTKKKSYNASQLLISIYKLTYKINIFFQYNPIHQTLANTASSRKTFPTRKHFVPFQIEKNSNELLRMPLMSQGNALNTYYAVDQTLRNSSSDHSLLVFSLLDFVASGWNFVRNDSSKMAGIPFIAVMSFKRRDLNVGNCGH